MIKRVMLVRHVAKAEALVAAQIAKREFDRRGIEVVAEHDEVNGVDMVLALGGDGTILAAAEHARHYDAPLLGVNMGHMGFLAEVHASGIANVVTRLAQDDYVTDTRMTLDVTVRLPDGTQKSSWALNDAVIAHTDLAHPVNLALAVDGQDVSTYGADGIIFATPTGSTAYNFAAGGPVVWPEAEAIVMTPLAAHGLFARPMVMGPHSRIEALVLEEPRSAPEVWCDGLRKIAIPAGGSVVATKGERSVRLIRLDSAPFATRLVRKFNLPVRGWRSGQRTAEEQ